MLPFPYCASIIARALYKLSAWTVTFWLVAALGKRTVDLALSEPKLSPRELAVRFTDQQRYFVSEASVYRLLKAHDLITSPAFIVVSAADEFHTKTTAPNQLWQTDFTYLKVIGWGWFYLSTVLDDFSRYIIAWKLCTSMTASDSPIRWRWHSPPRAVRAPEWWSCRCAVTKSASMRRQRGGVDKVVSSLPRRPSSACDGSQDVIKRRRRDVEVLQTGQVAGCDVVTPHQRDLAASEWDAGRELGHEGHRLPQREW